MTMRTFRIELVCESGASDVLGEILSDSVEVARVLAPEFEGLDREKFIVLLLDAKHRVIGVNTVSIGSLTASIVHPRKVFKPAIAGTLRRSFWRTTIRAEIRRRA
jgi:DNA repair protein RadC